MIISSKSNISIHNIFCSCPSNWRKPQYLSRCRNYWDWQGKRHDCLITMKGDTGIQHGMVTASKWHKSKQIRMVCYMFNKLFRVFPRNCLLVMWDTRSQSQQEELIRAYDPKNGITSMIVPSKAVQLKIECLWIFNSSSFSWMCSVLCGGPWRMACFPFKTHKWRTNNLFHCWQFPQD